MKKYLYIMLSGIMMTSCVDTIIIPNDVTVGEDYWKSKDDVAQMVNGAYNAMTDVNCLKRCIVWGSFRSDEMNHLQATFNNGEETALKEINLATMTQTNGFADWASLYSVINKCNIVLERAGGVVSIDPSYTMSTYQTDESQMLALRALCHFYLIRAFRDIPYVTVPSMTSSQNFEVPQEAPLQTLGKCIDDLNKALEHPLAPTAFSDGDWRKVGFLNKDAINAILADVYLWRGSMTHNKADYQLAIDHCNAVIKSRMQQYPKDGGSRYYRDCYYPLIDGQQMYQRVFAAGNSTESLFELQLDGSAASNIAVCNLYWNYDDKSRGNGLVAASYIFNKDAESNAVFPKSQKDYRYWESCVKVDDASLTEYAINKIANNTPLYNTPTNQSAANSFTRDYKNVGQNWIFYRLSDVLLMKVEAMVQLAEEAQVADESAEEQEGDVLAEAFYLLNEVNKRSLCNEDKSDSLKIADYNTKEALEELVLAERLRELCFEGKRWFDLLRFNYRHVEGAQPDKTMFEIAGEGKNTDVFPENYTTFTNLVQRKYLEAGAATMSKMKTEAHLYMPMLEAELKANPLLHQNPAWIKDDSYTKN